MSYQRLRESFSGLETCQVRKAGIDQFFGMLKVFSGWFSSIFWSKNWQNVLVSHSISPPYLLCLRFNQGWSQIFLSSADLSHKLQLIPHQHRPACGLDPDSLKTEAIF